MVWTPPPLFLIILQDDKYCTGQENILYPSFRADIEDLFLRDIHSFIICIQFNIFKIFLFAK